MKLDAVCIWYANIRGLVPPTARFQIHTSCSLRIRLERFRNYTGHNTSFAFDSWWKSPQLTCWESPRQMHGMLERINARGAGATLAKVTANDQRDFSDLCWLQWLRKVRQCTEQLELRPTHSFWVRRRGYRSTAARQGPQDRHPATTSWLTSRVDDKRFRIIEGKFEITCEIDAIQVWSITCKGDPATLNEEQSLIFLYPRVGHGHSQ